MRAIEPGMQLFNACAIDVEPDHRRAGASERDRHRKPDIAEADDRDVASWRQITSLLAGVSPCGTLRQRCGSIAPTRCERENNRIIQATAPGSDAAILASPKYIENTSARSGVRPWLPNRETIASSRSPQPPTVKGTSATPIITANRTAASAGDNGKPCARPRDQTAAVV